MKVKLSLTPKEAASLYLAAASIADDLPAYFSGSKRGKAAWERAMVKLQEARQKVFDATGEDGTKQ